MSAVVAEIALSQTPLPWGVYDPATVVTLDDSGNPLSCLKDQTWNFSAATRGAGTHLYFWMVDDIHATSEDVARQETLVNQQKSIIWKIMNGPSGAAFGFVQKLGYTLNSWCTLAYEQGISLVDFIQNEQCLGAALESMTLGELMDAGTILRTINMKYHGWQVAIPYSHWKGVISELKKKRPRTRQTPLMPSRVYTSILGGLIAELEIAERQVDELLVAYAESEQLFIQFKDIPSSVSKHLRASRIDSLRAVAVKYGYEQGVEVGVSHYISRYLCAIQVNLMHVVAAFTGMRVGECWNLPRENVLTSFEDGGTLHWLINGHSYKISGGRLKPTSWITNDAGRRAVELAIKISDAIAQSPRHEDATGERRLFCSFSNPCQSLAKSNLRYRQIELIEKYSPVLEVADIREMDFIEPGRDWKLGGIEIGARWPLAFHQFRRALAVYAHRSGLVSLPSLKGQLQHITNEMSLYYSTGFIRAASLVFDKEHVSHEWNVRRAEASYLGFALNLLMSDDELLGGGAAWIHKQRVKESPVSVHSREHAMGLFERGEISFRETPLGGCMNPGECKSDPLSPIPYECLLKDCEHQVVVGRKLNRVIDSQQAVVAELENDLAGSVEYRLEASNLKALLQARDSLKKVSV
jgi:hypothetical protein